MQRNTTFYLPAREPLRSDPSFALDKDHVRGPFSFLNPTCARLDPTHSLLDHYAMEQSPGKSPQAHEEEEHTRPEPSQEMDGVAATSIQFEWRSRDNRKGRHKLVVTLADSASTTQYLTPPSSSTPRAILHGIWRMATWYPVWNVSYLVAITFTLGSVIWVLNAFFVWLPLVQPSTQFTNEITVAGGWTAFVGATVFEVGSVLLMLEAVNENQAGCFGWALERALESGDEEKEIGGWKIRPNKGCAHHHTNKGNFVGKRETGPTNDVKSEKRMGTGIDESDSGRPDNDTASPSSYTASSSTESAKSWQWFPSWHDLTTHYIFELGFLACCAQMFGASVFWISGFTAIPQINAILATNQADLNGAYWVPQIVGGTGFIVSGVLFMLETQPKWYIPVPKVLGWQIGLWNLIGAFGFTLCGALGPAYGNSGAQFEASLATFWGSWAFLMGSLVQWYESLHTHPVEERRAEKKEAAG
ncbi:MAG: hypothetical protein LQ340_003624 [Diploschistes diacapsis]|nr:MAG: hypothetical protein LQ340_003624 [Diploschistes diacapsis]